jgi:CTP:molybdopterin cytidylyltransferase MocA
VKSRGIAFVLLAAGASRRLGTCKALISLGDPDSDRLVDTPLGRLLDAGSSLDAARPLLVTGLHHRELHLAAPVDVEVCHNSAWEQGRTGSVACAAAARRGYDLLLAPVDVPRVPRSVFLAMSQAWAEANEPKAGWLAPFLADPEFQGDPGASQAGEFVRRFGHPIIMGRELAGQLADLLDLAPTEDRDRELSSESDHRQWRDRPLHHWRKLANPLLSVPVESPEILDDLDDLGDWEHLRTPQAP